MKILKINKLFIALGLMLLTFSFGINAETIGPNGEKATLSSQVTVSDAMANSVKAKGYTAALLWHDQSDFVNAATLNPKLMFLLYPE